MNDQWLKVGCVSVWVSRKHFSSFIGKSVKCGQNVQFWRKRSQNLWASFHPKDGRFSQFWRVSPLLRYSSDSFPFLTLSPFAPLPFIVLLFGNSNLSKSPFSYHLRRAFLAGEGGKKGSHAIIPYKSFQCHVACDHHYHQTCIHLQCYMTIVE